MSVIDISNLKVNDILSNRAVIAEREALADFIVKIEKMGITVSLPYLADIIRSGAYKNSMSIKSTTLQTVPWLPEEDDTMTQLNEDNGYIYDLLEEPTNSNFTIPEGYEYDDEPEIEQEWEIEEFDKDPITKVNPYEPIYPQLATRDALLNRIGNA